MVRKIRRYEKESKLFSFIRRNCFYNMTFQKLTNPFFTFFCVCCTVFYGMTMQLYNYSIIHHQRFIFFKRTSYFFIVLLLSGLLPSYALSAEETVKKFYDNVTSKRCFDAVKLRPNYSLDSCENIDKIYLHQIKIKAEGQYSAVALVELDVEMDGKNTHFLGHTLVRKSDNKWFIAGPYKSEHTFSLDEYVAEFIPQGLQADGEAKKPSVKVAKKPASVHALPPGDAVDASSSSTAVVKIKRQSSEMSLPIAPSASVENEQKEQPALPKKLQHLTRTGIKPLQHNKEMDSYFLGNIPIQGNFVGLLGNIHALFPDFSQQVILIDKSQSILYLYKENNALAGFFPILTSSVAEFPSGLYQIGEQESEDVKDNKKPAKVLSEQATNESSITMKKLELGDGQQVLISDYYYLRNYFDKNQKQSLSLSPIDNNKLQQLILGETLVYIAE
jgi:hypothetical protein